MNVRFVDNGEGACDVKCFSATLSTNNFKGTIFVVSAPRVVQEFGSKIRPGECVVLEFTWCELAPGRISRFTRWDFALFVFANSNTTVVMVLIAMKVISSLRSLLEKYVLCFFSLSDCFLRGLISSLTFRFWTPKMKASGHAIRTCQMRPEYFQI